MAPLRERGNLFTNRFRSAPRPFLPEHWKIAADNPSAVRFWVDPESGRTASRPAGPDWTFSKTLRLWHIRQALRVWAGRRLLRRHGEEEALRRIEAVQTRLTADVPAPNTYLDMLLAIAYEVCFLRHRLEGVRQLLDEAQDRAVLDAEVWRCIEVRARDVRPDLALAADVVVAALDRAQDATQGDERVARDSSSVARLLRAESDRKPGKLVWEWIGYQSLPRNYRDPDLSWLLAQAILKYRDARDDSDFGPARQRVFRLLELLDASPEERHESRREKRGGAAYSEASAGESERTLAASSAMPASS